VLTIATGFIDRFQECCSRIKFGLNAAKCKSNSFNGFDYRIGGHELERVEEIKDLGVILDTKMCFLSHLETIISKSTRMLGFISAFLGSLMIIARLGTVCIVGQTKS
jgi:hypothetical protein